MQVGSPQSSTKSYQLTDIGIGAPGYILDKSDQFTEKLFKINIISHFTLIREFMPDMVKKNKGHIVGLASMASFVAPPGIVDYAATKAAVMSLHEGTLTPSLLIYHHF